MSTALQGVIDPGRDETGKEESQREEDGGGEWGREEGRRMGEGREKEARALSVAGVAGSHPAFRPEVAPLLSACLWTECPPLPIFTDLPVAPCH